MSPPHNQAAHDRYNSEPHPSRPFGAALGGKHAGQLEPLPRIGRTIKPRAAGPCKVCGERRFFCDCDNGEGE
jgi:hypothetical protein